MNCPVCGGRTRVIHCRRTCEEMYRQRKCDDCEHIFYTTESESESSRRDYLVTTNQYRANLRRKIT